MLKVLVLGSGKTALTEDGLLRIDVPSDRTGNFYFSLALEIRFTCQSSNIDFSQYLQAKLSCNELPATITSGKI